MNTNLFCRAGSPNPAKNVGAQHAVPLLKKMSLFSLPGLFAVVIVLLIFFLVLPATAAPQISIIPKPVKMVVKPGTFTVTRKTVIVTDAAARPVAEFLDTLLAKSGAKLPIVIAKNKTAKKNALVLRVDPSLKQLGTEGYKLIVTPGGVNISASAPAGIFYGVQTLRQLFPPEIESMTRNESIAPTALTDGKPEKILLPLTVTANH